MCLIWCIAWFKVVRCLPVMVKSKTVNLSNFSIYFLTNSSWVTCCRLETSRSWFSGREIWATWGKSCFMCDNDIQIQKIAYDVKITYNRTWDKFQVHCPNPWDKPMGIPKTRARLIGMQKARNSIFNCGWALSEGASQLVSCTVSFRCLQMSLHYLAVRHEVVQHHKKLDLLSKLNMHTI